tara:strand:- start:263 stop:928 length:666 start_codon:yes stop_codon:yes gene_type:complete
LFSSCLCLKTFKKISQNEIIISGTKFITKETLLKNSSLTLPRQLINIKTKYHERELKENLSLKNISITRQLLPFRLKINLQEREPIAYAERNLSKEIKKGFIDEEGFFINEEFVQIENDLPYQFRVEGWRLNSQDSISKIIQFYKNKTDLKVIYISDEGFITLEENKFKKVFLGNQPKNIDLKLKLISEIRSQLIDKEFSEKIEYLDLTDINNPTLKVFKP